MLPGEVRRLTVGSPAGTMQPGPAETLPALTEPVQETEVADEFIEHGPPLEEVPDIALPIRLIDLEGTEVRFVNNVHANFDQATFYLNFSQFLPPVVTGPDDARPLTEQAYVPASVVARFACTPLLVEQLIGLLQQQLDRFRSASGQHGTAVEEAPGA